MTRTRYVCENCGNSSRKELDCERCGMPLQIITLELSPFAIPMYAFASMAVISLAMLLALLQGGVLLGLPVLGFLFVALILSFWDDDWVDRKAGERAAVLRAQAPRCTTCWTALQFDARRDQGYCLRCRAYRVVEALLPPPPPP